jgi:hypothetical protein
MAYTAARLPVLAYRRGREVLAGDTEAAGLDERFQWLASLLKRVAAWGFTPLQYRSTLRRFEH